jgi:zinc/manganese transport system permease protein
LYADLLAFIGWRGRRLGGLGFYLTFALAITASVQRVGVYLVFASLIPPALAVRSVSTSSALLAGWLGAGRAGLCGRAGRVCRA